MRNFFVTFLSLVFFLLCGTAAQADIWGDNYEDEIVIVVGQTHSLPAYSPTKVGVAEPDIADIVTVDAGGVTLLGKSPGRTNFFVKDSSGDITYNLRVIPEDMNYLIKSVKEAIDNINLSGIEIKPVEDEGKVLLTGTVRTVEDKERLTAALGKVAPKVTNLIMVEEATLVEIGVEVLELTTGATKELGFSVPRSITVSETARDEDTSLRQSFAVGSLSRNSFEWKLDLLENEGKATILARPNLVCQSGKEAEFLVGGEMPVFSTKVAASGGSGTEIEYKEYGIKMKISPIVTPSERIELGIEIEISELGESYSIGSADTTTASAYAVKTREITTSLHLSDGETLAIGGLIRKASSEDLQKFPWLSDVPILGKFFTHRTHTQGSGATAKGDTELFITLTPRVVFSKNAETETGEKTEKGEFILQEQEKERRDIPKELQDYVLEVQRKILTNITYPASLVGTGWEGNIVLAIIIDETGTLKETQILKESGYKIFDEQALNLVKSLSYAPFPFDAPLRELRIEVPIVYREKN